ATDDGDNPALYSYALSCTQPGPDDTHFNIVVTDLRNTSVFDFHAPQDANQDNLYKICIQTSDGKLTYEENVTIEVTKRPEPEAQLESESEIDPEQEPEAQAEPGPEEETEADPQSESPPQPEPKRPL